jgi:hypothetical protein
MPTFDIDVIVSKNPPSFTVLIRVGGQQIHAARNAKGDWEGTKKKVTLTDPAPVELIARGISNQPVTLAVTLTPSDGSPAINYKNPKPLKLDDDGQIDFQGSIPLKKKPVRGSKFKRKPEGSAITKRRPTGEATPKKKPGGGARAKRKPSAEATPKKKPGRRASTKKKPTGRPKLTRKQGGGADEQ